MDWQTAGTIAGTIVATLAVVRAIGGGSWKLSGDIASMKTTLLGVQTEIKRQGDILEKLADVRADIRVANNRIDNAERRISNVEQDIRDLQHGEGMVLPLKSPYEK